MTTIEIRPADLGDAPALALLLRELGWFTHMNAGDAASPTTENTDRVMLHLEKCLANSSHSVYVAQDDEGEIVGYTAVHWLPYLFMTGPEGFISELFVRETARGYGLGARLLAEVKTEALTRGVSRLSLLNGRHRESYQRQFYEKQGWEERPYMANFVYHL